jgi:peptidyl-tRNA hydrolase
MKTKVSPPEYKLYILVRNDLISLNAGKAMAQVAHAANHFTATWSHLLEVRDYSSDKKHPFGTVIVLTVNKDILLYRIQRAQLRDGTVPYGCVWDLTYPFHTTTEIAALLPKSKLTAPTVVKDDGSAICFRKELTCGYIFVAAGTPDQVELVGDLPLYP